MSSGFPSHRKRSTAVPELPSENASDLSAGPEDDARARLLAAAGPVFARRGFDRATVREICGQAGMNVASVGYYFGDKFGLYREVFRSLRARCHAEHPIELPASGEPRSDLYRVIYDLLSRMLAGDDSGWESQLLMREMNHPTDVFVEMVEESFRPQFDRLQALIAAIAPPDLPQHALEQLALSVVGQCLYYRVGAGVVKRLIPADRLAAEFTVESLARHITSVVVAAAEHGLAREHAARLVGTAPTVAAAASSPASVSDHSSTSDPSSSVDSSAVEGSS